jgi:hypothetical protein
MLMDNVLPGVPIVLPVPVPKFASCNLVQSIGNADETTVILTSWLNKFLQNKEDAKDTVAFAVGETVFLMPTFLKEVTLDIDIPVAVSTRMNISSISINPAGGAAVTDIDPCNVNTCPAPEKLILAWVYEKSFATAPLTTVATSPDVPELLSKTTSSALVGTPAPPGPPEVEAQFVVVDASHVPAPPTQ